MSDTEFGASAQAMADTPDPVATLAAWRARGEDRHDPVRFRFLEALARRTAGHAGEARRVLDQKLALAMQAYRTLPVRAEAEPRHTAGAPPPPPTAAASPLAELLRRLQAQPDDTAAPAELRALRLHGKSWSRLSAERRLVQAHATAPGNAGPLHSHTLMLRALNLMRTLSPDYLSHFLCHVDALLWLDQAHGGDLLTPRDVLSTQAPARGRRAPRGR
ncbi:MAG: DUF2894 domain-containing protein [Burkholderiales bacterium]|nr:DUF2894 domain-containing protein [Burkholderiales bacterium]